MAEDMSEIISKITKMMNNNQNNSESDGENKQEESSQNNDFAETIKNILGNINTNSDNSSKSTTSDNSNSDFNNFDLDIETILKIKAIMEKMNSKDDPRSNLLMSLKPYLNKNRKDKLEQYVKLLNITKVADIMNISGGLKK